MSDHWFEPIAEHLGSAYLRYSFTKGTEQEVAFLVDQLGLEPGARVLDVGCGPGRHAHALATRGIEVHGVDISQRFVDLAVEGAPPGATFERADARSPRFDAEFDAAVSLCQGAFGLVGPGADEEVLAGMARALRPGGRVAVSAFSSYFSVKYQTDARFDAATATASERTEVKDEGGTPKAVDLHTTCYTPRELLLLAERAGLEPVAVWSVEPGAYGRNEPTIESAEFLLLATRPG
ncbi:MAG: class I SAM-dependent methyltransferase [Actinomycetota bacterium]|nr:class I SAM-dependent methyltransferase [Acidimicrobiia bacterium]MDQ3293979.1 class I SAM-dependent methyltransferase [Actinomycetota bacterium]